MTRSLLLAIVLLLPLPVMAVDVAAVVQAQVVLGQVAKIIDKYEDIQRLIDAGTIDLDVETPRDDAKGKFVLPFDADGNPTAWAEKAITAQAGAEVGKMAGDKAAGVLASKVPFGGLAGGFMKKKSKEIGAVTAIGGWDAIRESSSLSFDKMNEYSVFLHDRFNGTENYESALAAAMAIYPDLEKNHRKAIDRAYKDAKKRAKKLKKKR